MLPAFWRHNYYSFMSRMTCIPLYPETDKQQTGNNFVADTRNTLMATCCPSVNAALRTLTRWRSLASMTVPWKNSTWVKCRLNKPSNSKSGSFLQYSVHTDKYVHTRILTCIYSFYYGTSIRSCYSLRYLGFFAICAISALSGLFLLISLF